MATTSLPMSCFLARWGRSSWLWVSSVETWKATWNNLFQGEVYSQNLATIYIILEPWLPYSSLRWCGCPFVLSLCQDHPQNLGSPWEPLKSKLEIKRAWHAISSRVYWGTCDWPRKLRKTSRVLLGPVFSNNCRSVTWLCHRGNAIILILLMSKTHAFSSHHISTQALQTWPRFCSITPTLYSPDCLRSHHIWDYMWWMRSRSFSVT